MTLRHLRIFLAVCREGSATAAAERLYIAQPTVSVALRELESHYNVTLFDRLGRRLFLTDAGKQMRSYAQHIVALLDEMEVQAQAWEETGTLRLGSSITIGTAARNRGAVAGSVSQTAHRSHNLQLRRCGDRPIEQRNRSRSH